MVNWSEGSERGIVYLVYSLSVNSGIKGPSYPIQSIDETILFPFDQHQSATVRTPQVQFMGIGIYSLKE